MTVKEYERRERHICGDPSAECDMDCVHAGWQAIEIRKLKLRAEEAEAKLARVRELRKRLDLLWMSNGQVSKALDEALADPPHLTPSRERAEKDWTRVTDEIQARLDAYERVVNSLLGIAALYLYEDLPEEVGDWLREARGEKKG